jgi:uncharacterized protein
MRILIGISHPKHVYMFKNLIQKMEDNGHEIKVVAVEKEITEYLLKQFQIPYELIGINQDSLLKKILNLPIWEYKTLMIANKFKPDIFIGQALPNLAHVSAIMRKPFIVFEDTEHVRNLHKIVLPFADAVVTPNCYRNDLGKKQIRFDGYFELAYLHPNYFQPNPGILKELGLDYKNRYIILRFVSWEAIHDIGQYGLDFDTKIKLVKNLEPYGKIFISSEKELPPDLEKYRIRLPAKDMHNFMYYATFLFGESATMSSECAVMGVPSIFIDFEGRGYTDEEEEKYGLIYRFSTQKQDQKRAFEKAIQLLEKPDLKNEWVKKRERLLNDNIDVTQFMIDLVKKYDDFL